MDDNELKMEVIIMNNYKNSMVIYESAYLAISYLPDDKMKWEAMEGLLKYGFYGEIPESENPFINMIYVQAIPSMQNAKQRYEKAVENGRKGGKPTDVSTEEIIEMKKNGMTNKQVAEQLGCTIKNIENRVTAYNKTHPNNPNNLSVSVSVSESESVSGGDTPRKEEIANAKRQTKRELKDLDSSDLYEIIRKLKNRINYIDIQKEYNLQERVTKNTASEAQSIINNRNYILEQQAEWEMRKNEPYINYDALERANKKAKEKLETKRIVQEAVEELYNDLSEEPCEEIDYDKPSEALQMLAAMHEKVEAEDIWT